MKYLIMLLLPITATAQVNCYTTFNVTNCNNGVRATQYGNMTNIHVPGQQNIKAYQYGNQWIIKEPPLQTPSSLDTMRILKPLE